MPQRDANWQSMDYMLATVSLLYYRDGMTQEAIARRLGLSRPTIVAYLRRAREEGITEIRIAGAAFSSNRLSRDLCEAFGLADVFVAPTQGAEDADDPKLGVRAAARIGAMALWDIASPGGRIGIAWGETLDLLVRAMPSGRIADLSIYQVIGAMRSPLMYAAEYSAIRIAAALNAACNTLHAPALLSTPEMAAALRREQIIAEQLEQFDYLSCIAFTVGGTGPTAHIAQAGLVTAEELGRLRDLGAVGVVCGRLIDCQGRIMDVALHDRMIGISSTQFLAVPTRLGVVGGLERLDALRAALAGQWITHLVVDSQLALALMAGVDSDSN
jgi:DNA-binding transcriptional regulator LsrR (DeoR family)